jgi:hypothetical protein
MVAAAIRFGLQECPHPLDTDRVITLLFFLGCTVALTVSCKKLTEACLDFWLWTKGHHLLR